MTIGERIRAIRISKGIGQTELASATNISKQNIYKYETNIITNIPSDKIEAISRALDVSPSVIMGWEDFDYPALNDKDRRDIAKDLEAMMAQLDSSEDLMFDGDPISDEARESIRAAMKLGLEAAKVKNKEHFTPKKYRK